MCLLIGKTEGYQPKQSGRNMKEEKASSLSISSSSWAREREERSGERTPHAEQRYLKSPEEWPREDWEASTQGLSKL